MMIRVILPSELIPIHSLQVILWWKMHKNASDNVPCQVTPLLQHFHVFPWCHHNALTKLLGLVCLSKLLREPVVTRHAMSFHRRSLGEAVSQSSQNVRWSHWAIDMTWLWTCRNCWQGRARSIQILVDSCKSLSAGRLVSWCQLPWPRSSLGRNIAASGGTSNLAESRGKPVREWDTGSHSSLRIDMAHGCPWQNKFYKHWIA